MSRRRSYRVPAKGVPVQVMLDGTETGPTPVRLEDVSAVGARVRLPTDARPLSVGQAVTLRIIPESGAPLTLSARVIHRVPAVHGYGLAFLDTEPLDRELPPRIRGLFNRRGHARFRPVHPIFASLRDRAGHAWSGPIWDLAEGGVSVILPEGVASPPDGQPVTVRFALPADPERFVFDGTAHPRGIEAEGERWAVVFHDQDPVQRARLAAALAQHIEEAGS